MPPKGRRFLPLRQCGVIYVFALGTPPLFFWMASRFGPDLWFVSFPRPLEISTPFSVQAIGGYPDPLPLRSRRPLSDQFRRVLCPAAPEVIESSLRWIFAEIQGFVPASFPRRELRQPRYKFDPPLPPPFKSSSVVTDFPLAEAPPQVPAPKISALPLRTLYIYFVIQNLVAENSSEPP